MRIIAGELKGRRLKTPEDNRVRPTADKVKEAVFSMISPWIYDSTAVDLFAGTGNLGLEAISRGASHVIFVDKDRRSIALIRENAAYCRVEDRCDIIWSDYRNAAAKISGDGVFSDFEAFLFRQGDRQFGRIVDDVRSSQFRTGILRSKVKVHLALIRTGVGSWGSRDLSGQGDLGAVSRTGRADGNRRIFWIGYSYIAFYRSRAA